MPPRDDRFVARCSVAKLSISEKRFPSDDQLGCVGGAHSLSIRCSICTIFAPFVIYDYMCPFLIDRVFSPLNY